MRTTPFQSGVYAPINVLSTDGTSVSGLNNLGAVLGAFSDNTGQHGFLDNHGVFTTIDLPGSMRTVRG